MLDINIFKEQKEIAIEGLLKRGVTINVEELIELDKAWRDSVTKQGEFESRRNQLSKEIGLLRHKNENTEGLELKVREINNSLEELQATTDQLRESLDEKLIALPNIPDPDIAGGGKENNTVEKISDIPRPHFLGADHMHISERLNLVDHKRGIKLAGAGNWIYTGYGAMLEWALLTYFVQSHLKNGFTFLLPPHMLLEQCGFVAGQFPKFSEDVFWLKDDDNLKHFLLPTAETAIINFHRDEVLTEKELPKKYFSYTPCYRREAGSARTEERGTIRGHQFNKV